MQTPFVNLIFHFLGDRVRWQNIFFAQYLAELVSTSVPLVNVAR